MKNQFKAMAKNSNMRILQINCVYGEGSTGKIVKEIHSHLLSNGIESYVCYGRGEKTTDQNVIRTCSNLYSKANNLLTRITGLMYGGCYASTIRLIRQISLINPDIVHVHCINGYFVNIYELITFLKKAGFPTLTALFALLGFNSGHLLSSIAVSRPFAGVFWITARFMAGNGRNRTFFVVCQLPQKPDRF